MWPLDLEDFMEERAEEAASFSWGVGSSGGPGRFETVALCFGVFFSRF